MTELEAFFETTTDMVVTSTVEGRIVYANPAFRQAVGYDAAELAGMTVYDFVAPERHESARKLRRRVLEEGRVGPFETRWVTKHGRVLVVEGSASAHRAPGSAPVLRSIFRDVSGRKELERLKDEFVATVSHELRTPLTSIRGALGLLEAGVLGELPAQAREVVGIARDNSERLIRLINDVLDLEKISAGKMELALRDVPAAEIARAAVGSVRDVAAQAGVELAVDAPAGAVRADADRVVQVVTNLLSNAIKHSPAAGRVELRVSPGAAGRTRFTVEDHGPGIPADRLPRLFTRFEQLESPDRRKGGTGLGLAISKAIVEQHGGEIGVDSAPGRGSRFWFELSSTPLDRALPPDASRHLILVVEDDDTTAAELRLLLGEEGFRVLRAATVRDASEILTQVAAAAVLVDSALPDGAALAPLGAVRFGKPLVMDELLRAIRAAVRRPGAPRAVVVDDDAISRRALCTRLARLGIDCTEAGGGLEAIERVREVMPDLIVLDVLMPSVDGYQVVDILRQDKSRITPLLVYSGKDLDSAERQMLRLGPTRFLTRLAGDVDLVAAVRELLGGMLSERI